MWRAIVDVHVGAGSVAPSALRRALVVALACAGGLALASGARAADPPPGAASVVVAVWAVADGDTPLSGSRVQLYAAGHKPLRQLNGSRHERTYRTGVALLEFAKLPRAFTVEVSGGRAGGRLLHGAFREEVHGYRSGAVVAVNPVTTLIGDDVAVHRRRGLPITRARARREVYRLLRIPSWQDQDDLRSSDRYFDGDSYLRAARKAGGVAALNRALIREELRAGNQGRRFRGPNPAAAAAAAVDWLALLAGDPRVLAKAAFKALGLLAAQKVGGLAAEKAGNAALGWVLAAFGYGDVLKDQDMAEVKRALDALAKQVTQLQGQVQLAGFSTLVHQTDRTIGQIDHASTQLGLLANMPEKDPTKKAFTQTVGDYIAANLLDAPAILNQNLSSNVPLSDNLIKSASRVVAQRTRFFDAKNSAAVKSVYDYFAAYEVKLAVLLTEYFHTKPETYSPVNVKAGVDGLEANVDAQASSLKPAVPERAVVDTKTGVMWTQNLQTPPEVNLLAIAEIVTPRRGHQHLGFTRGAGPTALAGLPFSDWRIPQIDTFERLIEGSSGRNPAEWLEQHAHIDKRMLDAASGQMWVRDGLHVHAGTFSRIDITIFDLRRGKTYPRGSPVWFFNDGWRVDFENERAGSLYYRNVPAGESYWWGD